MNNSSVSYLRKPLARLFGAGLSLFAASAAFAQTTPTTEEEGKAPVKLEKFVVTGSYIQRIDTEGPAPVQIINRETIELSGSNTVQDVLKRIPSNFAGVNENINNQGSTGGAGNVSLRGLGANRTLVLLNGRRAGPAGVRGGVSAFDLNVIPVSAIDRVDILKDGASSVYGSDAVAGVVNIITKRDTDGVEIERAGGAFETRRRADRAAAGISRDAIGRRGARLQTDGEHRSQHDRRNPTGCATERRARAELVQGNTHENRTHQRRSKCAAVESRELPRPTPTAHRVIQLTRRTTDDGARHHFAQAFVSDITAWAPLLQRWRTGQIFARNAQVFHTPCTKTFSLGNTNGAVTRVTAPFIFVKIFTSVESLSR